MSRVSVTKSAFHERLAYARWVRQLKSRGAESDRELSELSGLGYEWLRKWKQRPDAPTERLLSKALARYLLVDEAWLLDNEGEPPRPDLWDQWIVAYRYPPASAPRLETGPSARRVAEPPPVAGGFQTKQERAAKKRRPGDKSA